MHTKEYVYSTILEFCLEKLAKFENLDKGYKEIISRNYLGGLVLSNYS